MARICSEPKLSKQIFNLQTLIPISASIEATKESDLH
jgi:hypothetical protein